MSGKKKILIVDDSAPFVELAKGILSQDFDMETAANGLEGLSKVLTFRPDAIMLDINMPGLTGIEFARRLAAHPATAGIPLLVITASDYNSLTESLLRNEHNVKVFMTKLSPIETIREKVEAVLAKKIP